MRSYHGTGCRGHCLPVVAESECGLLAGGPRAKRRSYLTQIWVHSLRSAPIWLNNVLAAPNGIVMGMLSVRGVGCRIGSGALIDQGGGPCGRPLGRPELVESAGGCHDGISLLETT